MKIAILTGEYFKAHETMVNRHIEHMYGGNTCVICSRYGGENPYDKPIHLRRLDHWPLAHRLRAPFEVARNYSRYRTSRVPWGPEKKSLIAFLKDQKVEAVLSEFGTQTVAIAPVIHQCSIPLFGYFRGVDATKTLRTAKRREAYKRMVPYVTAFISVSQFLLDNLAAHGIRHPNSFVIPSGVNIAHFTPGKKIRQRFVAVGRFVEKKQPATTIRAFSRAATEHPDATLEMVGDGPLLEECQQLSRELGMAGRITFRGALDHSGVRRAIRSAEVFLQHSVTSAAGNAEGLPTAIQEAMACGAVVLSTRHAGIPEAVIEGKSGLLVDEHDEDGFAQNISAVLTGQHDLKAMAVRARSEACAKFDNKKLLTKLEQIVDRLA